MNAVKYTWPALPWKDGTKLYRKSFNRTSLVGLTDEECKQHSTDESWERFITDENNEALLFGNKAEVIAREIEKIWLIPSLTDLERSNVMDLAQDLENIVNTCLSPSYGKKILDPLDMLGRNPLFLVVKSYVSKYKELKQ